LHRKINDVAILSVVVGVTTTLISGLFLTPVARLGIDVIRWGLPLPWIMRVVPSESQVLWDNLVADFAFWTVVAFVPLILTVYRSRDKASRQVSSVQ